MHFNSDAKCGFLIKKSKNSKTEKIMSRVFSKIATKLVEQKLEKNFQINKKIKTIVFVI